MQHHGRKPFAVRRALIHLTHPSTRRYRQLLRRCGQLDKYGRNTNRTIVRFGQFCYCSQCGKRMAARQAFICRAHADDVRCEQCLDRAGLFHVEISDYPSVLAIPASVWHR